jgi:hypothetical protein
MSLWVSCISGPLCFAYSCFMVATSLGIAHLGVFLLFHAPLQKEVASQVCVGRCLALGCYFGCRSVGDAGH